MEPRDARVVFLDLETYRTVDQEAIRFIEDEARNKVPASNTRKDLKEAWHTPGGQRERIEEALDKTAVDVMLAEPIIVTYAADDGPNNICKTGMISGGMTWTEIMTELDCVIGPGTVLVGHNIRKFDLKVILNTCRRKGVRPPECLPATHDYERVYDTMKEADGETPYVSLDKLALAYGLGRGKSVMYEDAPIDGSMVGMLYRKQEWDVLCEYAREDVEVLRKVYRKQTFDCGWGTPRRYEEAVRVIKNIMGGTLATEHKTALVLRALKYTGLLPRCVLEMVG